MRTKSISESSFWAVSGCFGLFWAVICCFGLFLAVLGFFLGFLGCFGLFGLSSGKYSHINNITNWIRNQDPQLDQKNWLQKFPHTPSGLDECINPMSKVWLRLTVLSDISRYFKITDNDYKSKLHIFRYDILYMIASSF